MEKMKKAEDDETREMLEEPDTHFNKLKAKIKLRVVKLYQEDIVKKAAMEKIASQPVVAFKDKYGRLM